jgi:hypothetical protein
MPLSADRRHALNAICPYFTMFPLEFPLRVLRRHRGAHTVLDPFCGRGTTLYAARHFKVRAVGIDCSPVAVSISKAKLASFSVEAPMTLATTMLSSTAVPTLPQSEFWKLAYHPETLRNICLLREALLHARDSDDAILLRAAALGVLHGPAIAAGSYLSNQMPRTFAPKPRYAVRFWNERAMTPPKVDVLPALKRKLERIALGSYGPSEQAWRDVHLGDSSDLSSFKSVPDGIDIIVTSPPYYGMRTYVADQWLRHWFLGGPSRVDYSDPGDLPSSSPADFATRLGRTWENLSARCAGTADLFVRFGAIPSRKVDAKRLLLASLEESKAKWRVVSIRGARTAEAGKRQVGHMRTHAAAVEEFDLHAVLT